MIKRTLAARLRDAAKRYPVVTVTGPRQSGKTTLVRSVFKSYDYASLEAPDLRALALGDPRGFLSQFKGPVVLDEVQRAPELFSYLQVLSDESGRAGQFILTGSQNFLLLESISQSLAGRTAVLHLMPLSLEELTARRALPPRELGRLPRTPRKAPGVALQELLFKGFYPRIHDQGIPARDWLGNYVQTYLERDVRNLLHVGDIEAVGRFVGLCAGRNAQLLDLSSLASDCGIAHTTARRWLSVLEASFILVLLRPYHRNFGKRLIKSPKLYFLDTGLLCYLLNIRNAGDLHLHSARGAVFESFVISEFHKYFFHRGERPPLFFWRDSAGHEIDLLLELGSAVIPVEVKSAQTIAGDMLKGIRHWKAMLNEPDAPSALIYGGDRAFTTSGTAVYPWFYV